ncbi:MAG: O-antigen ligase family protein [Herpetosiphon sp.]
MAGLRLARDRWRLSRNVALPLAGMVAAALPLVLLPPKVGLALIAALTFVVVTLIEPVWGLYGAVASVPVQDLVVLPGGLTVTQAVVVLAAGAWALRVMGSPHQALPVRWQWVWGLWLVWQLVAVVFSPYSLASGLQQWARWIAAWLVFMLTLGTVTSARRAWGLLAVAVLAPAVAALIGINQFVTAQGPASYLILGGRFARAAATFGKPNPFGGYLNMAWPLAGALAGFWLGQTRRKGHWQRRAVLLSVVCGGATAVLLGGLFASYSRGGWVGAVTAVFGMALLAGRRSALAASGALVLVLMVTLLGAFSVLPPVVGGRLTSITDNVRVFDAARETVTPENFAVVERMAQWQAGWRMWQQRPWIGIGPGSYSNAYRDYYVGRWVESQGHAHNYYIHTLAESGIPGLLFYLLLMATMFGIGVRLRRRMVGTAWGAVALGGCGIMLAVAGHNVFENLHVLNLGIQLSAIWGAMAVGLREGQA